MGDLDPKKLRTLGDIAEALSRHALALGEDVVHPSLGVTSAEIATLATLAAHHIQREIEADPDRRRGRPPRHPRMPDHKTTLRTRSNGAPPKAYYSTERGSLYLGKCEDVLPRLTEVAGQVNLVFTSPPFPLNHKKRYGNKTGEEYTEWLAAIAPRLRDLLAPDGSVVLEIGNAWEPGRPVQSLLPYRALLAFAEAAEFELCQEITYFNPARLPSPAQWVTVKRMRLKDATSRIWWLAKTDTPKANNRNVLTPYSKHMKRLLERGTFNAGARPSEHHISKKAFLTNNGGSIPPNLLQLSNTESRSQYLAFCRDHDIRPHPARMPSGIPEFFMRLLTDDGDLILDPFAGSNTTGEAAEALGRRWIAIEADRMYAASSIARFDSAHAGRKLPRKRG